jgi:hypothetical protein
MGSQTEHSRRSVCVSVCMLQYIIDWPEEQEVNRLAKLQRLEQERRVLLQHQQNSLTELSDAARMAAKRANQSAENRTASNAQSASQMATRRIAMSPEERDASNTADMLRMRLSRAAQVFVFQWANKHTNNFKPKVRNCQGLVNVVGVANAPKAHLEEQDGIAAGRPRVWLVYIINICSVRHLGKQ